MATYNPSAAFKDQEEDISVFQQLEDYAWDTDPEFQSGLQAILGSNPSAEQSEHLTLRARCFYFSRYGMLYAYTHNFEGTEVSLHSVKTTLPLISTPTKHGDLSGLPLAQMVCPSSHI